ncbi:MAG: molybdate ABC transporter permease subunit [Gammaproteobacteria bacterium]|nr:molybdate ABC transporter permease subunit [Gammaproteobacteria bacterium]
MDDTALYLSLKLAFWTCVILFPLAIWFGRLLAWQKFPGKALVEALIALPLVLPPTVLGFYLLLSMGSNSALGQFYHALTGRHLVFTFDGLLLASVIFNLPFAIQPMQRAFEAIPVNIREAAWCCGLSRWQSLWRIEFPLAWPGAVSALALTFAHTLGEFGVVLMVGGNIEAETKTIAISIYDRVQAFDHQAAGTMSAFLLVFSLVSIGLVYRLSYRRRPHAG